MECHLISFFAIMNQHESHIQVLVIVLEDMIRNSSHKLLSLLQLLLRIPVVQVTIIIAAILITTTTTTVVVYDLRLVQFLIVIIMILLAGSVFVCHLMTLN